MACAAGLAEGSGHRVHAQGQDTLVASATGTHDDRAIAEPGAAGAGTWIEGHPGMACVVTVDLDVEEVVTPVMAGWLDMAREMLPVDCVVDLDPPVPRSS